MNSGGQFGSAHIDFDFRTLASQFEIEGDFQY
jgi:hypothetical protein